MMKLIQNIDVYAPQHLGKKDVLTINDKIVKIKDAGSISADGFLSEAEIINGEGLLLTPGFIDSHVHVLGGGGEGGFANRTPEATIEGLTKFGVTTVVGCLGTDGIGRDICALVAKTKGLNEQGMSAYCYTGSYQIPVRTLTDSIVKDIMMIQEIIGTGEIAISDHRSSQPTFEEFARVVADTRLGGVLSGKAGIVNVHLGDSPRCLDLIERVVDETEIPASQILPTHINRNEMLFGKSIEYALKGGAVDFTGNEDIDYWETICDEVRVCNGIKRLLDACYEAKRIRDMLPPLPDGVTPSYIHFLDVIEQMEKNGTSVKVSDISDALNLPRPGVTRTVKEMEQKGYLTKKPSEEDARILYLFITDEGKKLSAKYNEQVFNALLPDLETISGEDAECTIRTIEIFYQVMCERRNDLDK